MTLAELHAAGLTIERTLQERLAPLAECLLAENQRVNLTGARTLEELWLTHFADALALLPHLPARPAEALADLGSGGGLPGLVLAAAQPERPVVLIEATSRKVAAQRRITDALGLGNAQPLWGRAEALAHDATHRERYAHVTARAVAELRWLAEYVSGLLRPGGRAWLYKTEPALRHELPAAQPALRACRLAVAEQILYTLPAGRGERMFLVLEKTAPLSPDLPRRGAGRPL